MFEQDEDHACGQDWQCLHTKLAMPVCKASCTCVHGEACA